MDYEFEYYEYLEAPCEFNGIIEDAEGNIFYI